MPADFIIVGAGTAGCVLAERLTTRGASVLILEAGGSDRHTHVQIPPRFLAFQNQARLGLRDPTPQPRRSTSAASSGHAEDASTAHRQ